MKLGYAFLLPLLLATGTGAAAHTASAPPTGTISGTVALDRIANQTRASLGTGATVLVIAARQDGTSVGTAAIGDVTTTKDGLRSITYTVSDLPLGEPITINVTPVQPAGASPLPTGFAWTVVFRPKSLEGAQTITLTTDHPAAVHVDFVPIALEIFPEPPH
jgi:hypothetical protein